MPDLFPFGPGATGGGSPRAQIQYQTGTNHVIITGPTAARSISYSADGVSWTVLYPATDLPHNTGLASAYISVEGLPQIYSRPGPPPDPGGSTTFTRAVRVLLIGDSQFAGRGAGTGSVQMDGARAVSVSARLAYRLGQAGVLATDCGMFEANNTDGSWALYDPQVATGSWAMSAAATNFGGRLLNRNATTSSNPAFAPAYAVDTFELYTPRLTYGTINYNVDGGAATSVPQSGETTFLRTMISTSLGAHTLNLARQTAAGGTVYLNGVVAYDSSRKEARLINGASRGWSTTDWLISDQPWRGFGGIEAMAPDIAIISLGTNDRRSGGAGNSAATFAANMQSIINKARATASQIILVTPMPINPASVATITNAELLSAYEGLAASNGALLLKSEDLLADWTSANAAGEVADSLHWLAPASDTIAQALVALVTAATAEWQVA